jgi:predicted permease
MIDRLRAAGRRLLAFMRLAANDSEMDEEMRFHVEMEARDLESRGVAPAEARRTALATFGGIMRYREEGREARGSSWLADLAQDLRYARRTLGRNRGYAFVSILTLALAIGASTAIFGVMNGVLLKPLPFDQPDKILQVWDDMTWVGVPEAWVTGPEVLALRSNLRSFSAIAVIRGGSAGISSEGSEPEQINFSPVSANFFEVLGRGPDIGRAFLAAEDVPNGPRVGIISHALFERRFAGDRSIVGKSILFDGQPMTIVGVLPRDFQYALQGSLSTPLDVDIYTPIQVSLASFTRGNHTFGVVARVKDGIANETALAELSRFSQRFDSTNYGGRGFRFKPIRVRDRLVREVRPAIVALMFAVGLLVVAMSANLATLSLARASRREREFAVRRALGAGIGRIARQVFAETMFISGVGAVAGVLLAIWGLRGLLALAPLGMPRRGDIAIDPVVILFTAVLGVVVGVAMGLAPLVHSARVNLAGAIGEKASTGRGGRMRGTLVVAQVALSMMLLAGTALLLASFARLMKVDGGFRADGAVMLSYVTPAGKYRGSMLAAYHQRVVDRMRAIPGVTDAGISSAPPLSANSNQNIVWFPASPENNGNAEHDAILADFMTAGPDYFRAMGIPLLEGREFTTADDSVQGHVAIIDEQMARRFFPNGSAVNQLIRMDTDTGAARVIGVVGTVYQYGLREAGRPQVYAPDAALPYRGVTTVLRTSGDEAAVMRAARAAFHEVDPAQPIETLTTMRAIVDQSLGDARLVLVIVATFALTALLLAAIGIYGVTATSVTARSREMGIRVALGARPREVLGLMISRPIVLAMGGVGLGLAGILAGGGVLSKLLYGVSATDPATIATVTVILIIIAVVAAYAPARRATRVDAATVLRAN